DQRQQFARHGGELRRATGDQISPPCAAHPPECQSAAQLLQTSMSRDPLVSSARYSASQALVRKVSSPSRFGRAGGAMAEIIEVPAAVDPPVTVAGDGDDSKVNSEREIVVLMRKYPERTSARLSASLPRLECGGVS